MIAANNQEISELSESNEDLISALSAAAEAREDASLDDAAWIDDLPTPAHERVYETLCNRL